MAISYLIVSPLLVNPKLTHDGCVPSLEKQKGKHWE